jgi:hypothetical protein
MIDTRMQELSLSLSILTAEKKRIQDHLSSLVEEEGTLRNQIHESMQEQGVKTFEGHGLQLVRSNRKSVNVTDETALINHLHASGMYGTYQKLDLIAAKKAAVKNQWPGVEEVVTDVLSVKEIKA